MTSLEVNVGRLAGRVALVTGAASGIGRSIAERFAFEGAKVAVVDVSGEEVAAAAEIGSAATPFRADVSLDESMDELLNAVMETFGRLDIVCNNAGVDGDFGPLADCTVENFDRVIAVNLRGVFLGMKHSIPHLLACGGGSIINMSSAAAIKGQAGLSAYCASKAGVIQMTRAAAIEYGEMGLRINAICPGAVETPLAAELFAAQPELLASVRARHPIGRLGSPEDIAATAAFLASDDASFITGAAISVDGGFAAT